MPTPQTLFRDLIASGLLDRRAIVPCTSEDIRAVEAAFGAPLPGEYLRFLTLAGRGCGGLFAGTDLFYPRVLELRAEAEALLDENGLRGALPADAWVFCMHQGYAIACFTPGGEDPPVLQYVEGQDGFRPTWPAFTAFVADAVRAHLQARGRLD